MANLLTNKNYNFNICTFNPRNTIMKKSKKELKKLSQNIKLVLTDVDGVLTDGGMYYSDKGEAMKKFNTRDSMGMDLLKEIKIPTIMITRENSEIVKQRAKKIKIELFSGVLNKNLLLPKICKKFNVHPSEIAYIGDDVNDYEIMSNIGVSAAPNDAVEKICTLVDYVCKLNGGHGAFREFAEIIILK